MAIRWVGVDSPVGLIEDFGAIDTKDTTGYRASDHFAVWAVIDVD